MTDPISPIDCPHHGRLFIQSHSSSYKAEQSQVSVCPRCGEFLVTASKSGASFRETFTLCTPELVAAAGVYLNGLEMNSAKERTP